MRTTICRGRAKNQENQKNRKLGYGSMVFFCQGSLKSTDEFVLVLSKGRNIPLADLVQVTKGGNASHRMPVGFTSWLLIAFLSVDGKLSVLILSNAQRR